MPRATNLAQRHALIEQTTVLGAADVLRMDAVRSRNKGGKRSGQAVNFGAKLEQNCDGMPFQTD